MISWGIIGCGDVCEVKSGPAFARVPDSRLVAVMRRDGAKAADYARRHGVPRWYDDAAALIADPAVDAVYIATPPGAHAAHALAALAAGKPVYVEKPMARHAPECEAMIAAAHAAGRSLWVAYYRRGLDRFVRARELVQGGALGTVSGVRYRFAAPRHRERGPQPWRVRAEEAGGGLFLDLASHTLDILDFILGPLGEVQGLAANRAGAAAVEDVVAMAFRVGGAPGTAQWNFAAVVAEDVIAISGTEGELTLSTFGDDPLRVLRADGSVESIALPNPRHIQEPLIRSIVDEWHGRGRCPSTGESALRTQRVMDAVLAGYYGGRDDAFWAREASWPGRRG